MCSVRGIGVALMAMASMPFADFLEALLVLHAETLLFVDDDEAEIFPCDIFREQAVRADHEIHFALRDIFQDRLDFFRAAEAAEHFDAHRERLEALLERLECWKQSTVVGASTATCLPSPMRFESRAHHDFGLAVTDVAAEQAVHRLRAFHVALDIGDGGFLIARFGEFEGVFEFALPVAVGGETRIPAPACARRKASEALPPYRAFCVLMRVLVRVHVAPPILSSCGFRFAFAAKSLHQIHARQRHVELVAARIFEQHVVAFGIALGDLADAEELADAVFDVDHVIAGLEIELIGGETLRALQACTGFAAVSGDSKRSSEPKIASRAFLKYRAARDVAADQRDARAQRLRALLQIFRHLLAAEIDLIGNRILG